MVHTRHGDDDNDGDGDDHDHDDDDDDRPQVILDNVASLMISCNVKLWR